MVERATEEWLNAVPPMASPSASPVAGNRPTPAQEAIAAYVEGAHAPTTPPSATAFDKYGVGGGDHLPGAAKRDAKAEMERNPNVAAPEQRTWQGLDKKQRDINSPKESAVGAFVTTPGGWVPKSESATREIEGGPPSLESVAAFLGAQDIRKQAAYERGIAQSGFNDRAVQLEQEKIKAQEAFIKGRRDRDGWVNRVVAKRRAAIDKMEADIAQEKYKPLDHWARGSLLGALVAGISGFAAGLGNGENQFLKNVRYSMEAKYQAQKDQIARGERSVDRASNELEALQKIHGDDELAKLNLFNLQLASMENQLKKLSMEKEGTLEGTKYKEALADIMMERAKWRSDLDKAMHGKVTEKADRVFVPPKTVAVGGAAKKKGTGLFGDLTPEEAGEFKKVGETEIGLGIPLYESVQKDLDSVIQSKMDQSTREQFASYLQAGKTDKANELFAGWISKNPQARARLKQASMDVLLAQSGKAATDSERAAIQGFIGAVQKNGPAAAHKALSSKVNILKRQAFASHPHVYDRYQRLKRAYDEAAPMTGRPDSEEDAAP